MAHLCITEKTNELAVLSLPREKSVEISLKDGLFHFRERPANPTRLSASGEHADRFAVLVPWEESNGSRWALICSRRAGVSVSGMPILTGLKHLVHEDAITMAGCRVPLDFVDEDPAIVSEFSKIDHEVKCLRCKRPLSEGDAAVQCPSCSGWHHDGCWSYEKAKTCASPTCAQPNTLGEFSRSPSRR